MTTTNSANIRQQAKRMSKAIIPQVNALLIAKAVHETIAPKIDAMCRKILAENEFFTDPEMTLEPSQRVTDPAETYLIPRDDWQRYYDIRDEQIRLDGWSVPEKGYCPAAMADFAVTKAEWALCAEAEKFVPEMNHDRLCYDMEKRERGIEIMIGLAVNCPGYKTPSKTAQIQALSSYQTPTT